MTFTKLFSSITESTIWTEDHPTRLTWITMLAMADRKGRVWASLPGLANRARVTLDEAEAAIKLFLSPDKYSRTSDHEGRRIEPIDGGWRLLNHEKYRSIRDEEVIKESKRKYINTRRELERDVENVDRSRHNAEAEAEAEALPVVTPNKTDTSARPRSVFNKPKIVDVQMYCRERGNSVDPSAFVDFYESNGWKVGRNAMKDWRAAVRTWEKKSSMRQDKFKPIQTATSEHEIIGLGKKHRIEARPGESMDEYRVRLTRTLSRLSGG